jgi:hypothetical protein
MEDDRRQLSKIERINLEEKEREAVKKNEIKEILRENKPKASHHNKSKTIWI